MALHADTTGHCSGHTRPLLDCPTKLSRGADARIASFLPNDSLVECLAAGGWAPVGLGCLRAHTPPAVPCSMVQVLAGDDAHDAVLGVHHHQVPHAQGHKRLHDTSNTAPELFLTAKWSGLHFQETLYVCRERSPNSATWLPNSHITHTAGAGASTKDGILPLLPEM